MTDSRAPSRSVRRARLGLRLEVGAALALIVALGGGLVAISPAAASALGFAPAAVSTTGAGAAAAPSTGSHAWTWPVPAPIRVVSPFRAPPTPYKAGHRGIDLLVEPAATVVAAAPGTVSYAGMVAGRGVVAIDHGDGVVSSIEPVAASVARGEVVSAGDVIGTVTQGGHCTGDCVHFGVRVHGEYVSPFLFLGGLPRAVLLPME
ncbi:M23 family metallopeptidase [Agromyces sp. SYSU K20354]|uniref:M23 family metallopeptidase n=1 Tax=Agromyces cavernae TaxID=2898659 RepID=UPI001E52832C|nr:M23 family metallopeptidase [Agromyces cavernae]MCD2442426.1 M23 family metallopeptidase [Agromyces cavernae]